MRYGGDKLEEKLRTLQKSKPPFERCFAHETQLFVGSRTLKGASSERDMGVFQVPKFHQKKQEFAIYFYPTVALEAGW